MFCLISFGCFLVYHCLDSRVVEWLLAYMHFVEPDKVLYEMMMNTVCNSNLLFIKYIYYAVQVEFCYKLHICVELLVV